VPRVQLGADVDVHLSGASIDGVGVANLAHHRPHRPAELAAARARVGELSGTDPTSWHLMRQVHGASIARVDGSPRGAELRGVDALFTTEVERPLVVLTADCVPLVLSGPQALAVVHAGWRGVIADITSRTVEAIVAAGEDVGRLQAMVGPSIGPCCYAVGEEVRDAVAAIAPEALATTRDGRPAVDLVAACRSRLRAVGIPLDTGAWECTACGGHGWFSHRRDPSSGRQATIAVRRATRS
jgi:polyphenol oxidase